MFASADRFVRDSLQPVQQHGFAMMSVVLLALIQNVDMHGTRLTTIAQRARMTKASMMELVNKAQALGLVERQPDPVDKRAKIVAFTPLGEQLMAAMRKGITLAERRLLAATSRVFVDDMKTQLLTYAAGSGQAAEEEDAGSRKGDAWRTHNSSRILLAATDRFVGDVLRVVHEAGFRDVTPVLLSVFRNLDREGTRLTDLAARAKLTKQAMAELVERGEAAGFLEKCADPSDQRAKIIVFTAMGHEALDRSRDGVMHAEAEMARATSPAFVQSLREQLLAYVQSGEADGAPNTRTISTAQSRRLASPAPARP